MRIKDSLVLSRYFETSSSGNYDFYRCFSCKSLITRHQEKKFFELAAMLPDKDIRMCPCGSLRYSPGWPVRLEWLTPRVIKFVSKLILVRVVATWAEKNAQWALPYIERIVRNEWEELTWPTTT